MKPKESLSSLGSGRNFCRQRRPAPPQEVIHNNILILLILFISYLMAGCVSDKIDQQSTLISYQQILADRGPQKRIDTEGQDMFDPLGLLKPIPPRQETSADLEKIKDPNSREEKVRVSERLQGPVAQQAAEFPGVAAVKDRNTGQGIVLSAGSIPADHLKSLEPSRQDLTDTGVRGESSIKTVEAPDSSEDHARRSEPEDSSEGVLPDLDIATDPYTGQKSVNLTVDQAVARTLANSPEIRVVSFDPSIARQDVTKAAAEFDITAFGRINYEDEDNPPNSIFQAGQSDVRTFESGIKQKGVTGSEWSLSYGLTRSWDDLYGRTLATRYEPMLGFQLKQPLLRDAGHKVTLAGVDVAKLNYKIALLGFRQKAEETAVQVIAAYWQLLQARRDLEIQQKLLDRATDTLKKVEGRRQIDSTDIQIKQTEASAKSREAALLQAKKALSDAQDALVRLMADVQMTVLDEFDIVPVSSPLVEPKELNRTEILEIAMKNNPVVQQARTALDIAEINIRVSENQDMPRLDLIASARTQALARDRNAAQDKLETGEYYSYAVGLSLEYPLGNRQREAEMIKRRLERRQAISALQNVADQVAIAAKEGARRIETNFSEIVVQKSAVEAARIHLQTLEDSEPIRERLTPEFLLVKLQAQEALANAERAEIRSIVDFSISLAQLAQVMGTVLELNQVSTSLSSVLGDHVLE